MRGRGGKVEVDEEIGRKLDDDGVFDKWEVIVDFYVRSFGEVYY